MCVITKNPTHIRFMDSVCLVHREVPIEQIMWIEYQTGYIGVSVLPLGETDTKRQAVKFKCTSAITFVSRT